MQREIVGLDGDWLFHPDPHGEGTTARCFSKDFDTSRWIRTRVPVCFDDIVPGLAGYEGYGWFKYEAAVPERWRGRRVLLRFEGVHYHARVWVNGEPVGEHGHGFLPFEFQIERFLQFGQTNSIMVMADNIALAADVPGWQRGWRNCGGIQREVCLVVSDHLHLRDTWVRAEPGDDGGRLEIETTVTNLRDQEAEAAVSVSILDAAGKVAFEGSSEAVRVAPGDSAGAAISGTVKPAAPWSPDIPVLYTARLALEVGGEAVDGEDVRFGFRKIEVDDTRMLLNGEPIYLTGFNRHEDSPTTHMATDLVTTRNDLMDMKEAGCNFVRLAHYPHDPREVDLCDEIGLLVMDEVPHYMTGKPDPNLGKPEEGAEIWRAKISTARHQLERMILRDRNHPSVIFWSVSNEAEESIAEMRAGNAELIKAAKQLDRTRLVMHVSNRWRTSASFEEDDVVCINGCFVSAKGSPNILMPSDDSSYDLSESTRRWQEELEKLRGRWPGKPIMITEFSYPSMEGVFGGYWGEDLQAQALTAQFAGLQADYVCGACIWCWSKHSWAKQEPWKHHSLSFSPGGVVTHERRKLAAYEAVKRMFRERQGWSP